MPDRRIEATARTENSAGTGLGSRPTAGVSTLKGRTGAGAPAEIRGKTTVADGVVAKVADMAAREVPGIHNLGGAGTTRAFGAMRQRLSGGNSGVTRGVRGEVGERRATADLDVVVEYRISISTVDVTVTCAPTPSAPWSG